MDDPTEWRYDMIWSEHVIAGMERTYEGCMDYIVDIIIYYYEALSLKDPVKT